MNRPILSRNKEKGKNQRDASYVLCNQDFIILQQVVEEFKNEENLILQQPVAENRQRVIDYFKKKEKPNL